MRGEYSDDDTNVSLSLPGYNVQKTNPTVTGNSSKVGFFLETRAWNDWTHDLVSAWQVVLPSKSTL